MTNVTGEHPGDKAIRDLHDYAGRYARLRADVERECNDLAATAALMRKWGESRSDDAISQEAKARAIADLRGEEACGSKIVADEGPVVVRYTDPDDGLAKTAELRITASQWATRLVEHRIKAQAEARATKRPRGYSNRWSATTHDVEGEAVANAAREGIWEGNGRVAGDAEPRAERALPPIAGGSPEPGPIETLDSPRRAEHARFMADRTEHHRGQIVRQMAIGLASAERIRGRWGWMQLKPAVDSEAELQARVEWFRRVREQAERAASDHDAEIAAMILPISGGSPEADDDHEEGSAAWMNRFARKARPAPRLAGPVDPIRDEDVYRTGRPS